MAMGRFYVYEHLRKDNSQPFYVGKGAGSRASQMSGRSKRWVEIAEDAGGFVSVIRSSGLSEPEAKDAEAILIAHHGREIDGGCLVNVRVTDRKPLSSQVGQKPISLALDPEILDRLDAWIEAQEFAPKKREVFERALTEFLDKREAQRGDD